MRMEPQEYSEAEVVDINNVITRLKTQRTPKTLSNPVITSTRKNLNTIVKGKTLHIVVVVSSVVEVIVVAVVVVATVTGKKQDQFRKLS
jgi:DNA-binding transcriptional regulator YbjK